MLLLEFGMYYRLSGAIRRLAPLCEAYLLDLLIDLRFQDPASVSSR